MLPYIINRFCLKFPSIIAMHHMESDQISDTLVVLFDGRCGFCKASVRFLRALDWRHRLLFVNFYDPAVRAQHAPTIDLRELQKAMHVKSVDGSFSKGFYAFRMLAWELPLLLILVPFLYVPGVPMIGERVYGWVAGHRRHYHPEAAERST